MTLQRQKLLDKILLIRHLEDLNLDAESLDAALDNYLVGPSAGLVFEAAFAAPWSSTMSLIQDAEAICSEMAQADESFVTVQFSKLNEKFESALAQGRLHGPSIIPSIGRASVETPPSFTERLRVRRALWRLRLYHGSFCSTQSTTNEKNLDEQRYRLRSFFRRLTVRELEKIECVWDYLRIQPQLYRKACPHCSRQFLSDEILIHTRQGGRNPTPVVVSAQACFMPLFEHPNAYFQESPDSQRTFITTIWPASITAKKKTNAGWQYAIEDGLIYDNSFDYYWRNSTHHYLKLGYCIWDKW